MDRFGVFSRGNSIQSDADGREESHRVRKRGGDSMADRVLVVVMVMVACRSEQTKTKHRKTMVGILMVVFGYSLGRKIMRKDEIISIYLFRVHIFMAMLNSSRRSVCLCGLSGCGCLFNATRGHDNGMDCFLSV